MLNMNNELLITSLMENCYEIYKDNVDNLVDLKSLMENVLEHGCSSGVIPQLIYTRDTEQFVRDNLSDILELFKNYDITIPYDINKIAWITFELVTSELLESIDWNTMLELE